MLHTTTNKILTIAAVLLFAASISACEKITKPQPFGLTAGMVEGAPPGTPGFRYGWKHGCESGLAAYGSLHYKATYDFTYDSAALADDEYQQAWELGFRHCRWYASTWLS